MLLIKIGMVVPLLLLGAVNLFYIRPRLGDDGKALQLLRKTVTTEAILVALVLLSVGILVSMEPARQTASRQSIGESGGLVLQQTIDRENIKLIISPGDIGPNLMTIFLTDQSGRPIADASAVTVNLTYLNTDIGTSTESAVNHGDGAWVVQRAVFNVAGNWEGELLLQSPASRSISCARRASPGLSSIIRTCMLLISRRQIPSQESRYIPI